MDTEKLERTTCSIREQVEELNKQPGNNNRHKAYAKPYLDNPECLASSMNTVDKDLTLCGVAFYGSVSFNESADIANLLTRTEITADDWNIISKQTKMGPGVAQDTARLLSQNGNKENLAFVFACLYAIQFEFEFPEKPLVDLTASVSEPENEGEDNE